ncbi:hypothetical protein [Mahella sp.]|uniref:hypothetical protein n=1 Tax=Mahella sp. TaxID=2798721 RepID=UPI0025BD49D8|nr:hypothetical protein [Mahella sp.]MBZ4665118.1 hypothetical protein [Mahella sp.]
MAVLLKRHMAIIAAFVSVTVVLSVYSHIYASAGRATVYIEDIYGDQAELNGITVNGVLQDRYHRLIFDVKDGETKTRTEYNQHYKDIIPPYYNVNYNAKMFDGIQYTYELEPGWKMKVMISYFDLRSMDQENWMNYSLDFTTDVIGPGGNQYSLTNDTGYAMASTGGKIYFTVPTTREYTGTNGIYEIVKFYSMSDRLLMEANNLTSPKDAVRTVTTFSLDGNKDGGPTIEVLGLEAAGDKLALILAIDGMLVVRTYDPKSGAMLGEVALDDFRLVEYREGSEDRAKAYYPPYHAFSDNRSLNLCFRSSASTQDADVFAILSFDVSEGITLESNIEERYTEGEPERFWDITAKNGKLYVVVLLRERRGQSFVTYDVLFPKRLLLYAYKAGTLVYKGELVTDMDDDVALERQRNISGDFIYDVPRYRHFADVELR